MPLFSTNCLEGDAAPSHLSGAASFEVSVGSALGAEAGGVADACATVGAGAGAGDASAGADAGACAGAGAEDANSAGAVKFKDPSTRRFGFV